MAEVKPFKGVRYDISKAGEIKNLVCPPYDIVSEEKRKELAARSPYNLITLELPAGEGMAKYQNAKNILADMLEGGILRHDGEESFYIYGQSFFANGRAYSLKGLIGLVKLEEFEKGIVLPHEETLSKAKEDRFNLMTATGCNFSQIYCLYNDDDKRAASLVLKHSSGRAEYEFEDDEGTFHSFWRVCGKATGEFTEVFKDKKLYIADGHHRYETGLRYRDSLKAAGRDCEAAAYIMMGLVDMENPGLVVLPTHRLLSGLAGFDANELVRKASGIFKIEEKSGLLDIGEDISGGAASAFALYTGGDKYYKFTLEDGAACAKANPDKSEAYRSLDVTVLHSLVLEGILGIDKANMASQKNLTYTRSIETAIEEVRAGRKQAAFILRPTAVSQIRDVAAAGEKMPQKSTYFYPKLITGTVINKIL